MAFSQHDKIVFIFDLTETTVFNFQCLLKNTYPFLKKFESDIRAKIRKKLYYSKTKMEKGIINDVFFLL